MPEWRASYRSLLHSKSTRIAVRQRNEPMNASRLCALVYWPKTMIQSLTRVGVALSHFTVAERMGVACLPHFDEKLY
jgi:hypothetical protein